MSDNTKALRDARDAIASLDADAFGYVTVEPEADGETGYQYPIRDELLADLDKALAPPTEDEALERARTVMKRVSRELRGHADNISPRLKAYPADMMLREAARLDAAISRHAPEPLPVKDEDAAMLCGIATAIREGGADHLGDGYADRLEAIAARLEEARHG